MFLGRNRFQGEAVSDGGFDRVNAGAGTEFFNQADRPVPLGMQRFLAKKGINSTADLNERLQYVPRMPFRRAR